MTGAHELTSNELFGTGYERGWHMAERVLDLTSKGYSPRMRVTTEIPEYDEVPMTVTERKDYLTGYANGISARVSSWGMREWMHGPAAKAEEIVNLPGD